MKPGKLPQKIRNSIPKPLLEDALKRMLRGEVTIAELKGLDDRDMHAGIAAGRKLMAAGQVQAAAEVLSGMALYDPYRSEVWQALEELFRKSHMFEHAELYAGLARAMSS